MICLKEQYFSVNRILLLAVGLWPYEQSKFTRFQFIFTFVVSTSIIIAQLMVLLTSRFTLDNSIKVLSSALLFSAIEVEYFGIGIDIEIVQEMFAQFQHVYAEINDKDEIAIAEKYGYSARRYTTLLAMFAVCAISSIIVAQLWSDILYIIFSINTSQSHLPIMTEYFVNQEKYFYLIMLHTNVTISLIVLIMVATGTMFITFFHCLFGMFRIARYRIEHSINVNMLLNNNVKNEDLVSKRFICAVHIQREAMSLSILLVSKFEALISCLIIFGVASLSFNIFGITSYKEITSEMLLYFSCIIGIILYMFFANYIGQVLMDHSKDVFSAVYNVQWYIAPVRVQRLVLFLLQRGSKDFNVNVGRLFSPSLEGFATLVKASVSYFTVIHSIQ